MRVYLDNCVFNRPFDDQSSIADYFITTDKKLITKHLKNIKILSPIDFVINTQVGAQNV